MRTAAHLVLTGSSAGHGIRPGNLYSATKWAVTALAQNIRAYAPRQPPSVNVNEILIRPTGQGAAN